MPTAATRTAGGDREVDPEVPLRPERVDDSLGGVVEAVEERRAALAGCSSRLACSRSRAVHLGTVVVSEQVQEAVDERRPPRVPDDRGQSTTSPSARGTPSGSSSRPSSGKERTSVSSSMPEVLALELPDLVRRRRTRSRARRPRRPRPRARAAQAPQPPSSSDLHPAAIRRLDRDHAARPHRLRAVPVSSAWRLYASTIRCTSLCRTTSSCPNSTKQMPSIPARICRTWISPDACSRGRSIWVMSPGDDHLRAETEPRQEHLHLLGRSCSAPRRGR